MPKILDNGDFVQENMSLKMELTNCSVFQFIVIPRVSSTKTKQNCVGVIKKTMEGNVATVKEIRTAWRGTLTLLLLYWNIILS